MRLGQHVAASGILSGILFYAFRSAPLTAAAFLSGIFMDLDHVLDCYLNYGIKFRLSEAMDAIYSLRLKKALIFLHSYELLLLYVFYVWFNNKWGIWYGIAVGMYAHLLLDLFYNGEMRPNTYFFTKRLKLGFEHKAFMDLDAYKNKMGIK